MVKRQHTQERELLLDVQNAGSKSVCYSMVARNSEMPENLNPLIRGGREG